jgi:hypothetical protein
MTPTTSEAPLHAELSFFESKKSLWLKKHHGKYVVVRGNSELGFYESFAAAHAAGSKAFGSDREFLIKKIVEDEPVFVIY